MVMCMEGPYRPDRDVEARGHDPPEGAWIGETVRVVIDRPAGSVHPDGGPAYPFDYGYLPGTLGGDGEPIDVYVLDSAGRSEVEAHIVAVIVRHDDDENKLVAVVDEDPSTDEIEEAVRFQEQWFETSIFR